MNDRRTAARDEPPVAIEPISDPAGSPPPASISIHPIRIRSITTRYYLLWLFGMFSPSFIFAVYPLFLRSRGLNQFQINGVAAVYFLVTFLTDVPTGAFADALGRRTSVVIGAVLHAGAFLLYFVSHHYWHFIVAEITDGVATTFCNGAIDAWAVDALDEAGFEGPKDRLFSRAGQIWRAAAMVGALVGAYVAKVDIAVPFLMGAIANLVFGAVALAMMDGHRRRTANFDARTVLHEIRERMFVGTRAGFASRPVLLMATASMVGAAALVPFWNEWQGYFLAHLGMGIEVVGWLFCLFTIAQMAGSEVVVRMSWAWRRRAAFMAAATAISSIAFIVAGIAGALPVVAFAAFMVYNACGGATNPVLQSWFNEQIDGDHRATLLSFQTTFATFGASAGLPVQGRLVDSYGVGVAWQAAGVLAMLQVPCYLALRKKKADAD
ncbi:MAG TPA: MFS transporter [Candidatus Binataceae bacterium]